MDQIVQTEIKILVVDDETDIEPLIKQKFRRQIRDKTYSFIFAVNGLEALARIVEYPEIGIILSDINMPEMDGLTLLTKLKELKNPKLKTVIVSAYGDMDNIRTAMNRGAFDFITKPVDFEDLEITINKTLEEIKMVRQSMAEHDQLISIQKDLTTAKEIQQAILPKVFPPFPTQNKFDIFASMVPATEVGGDFYDFFLIDEERVGFVVGDVSGKGIPAAIFMAVSRTLIRATGIKGFTTSECMDYVNNLLCNESTSSMFVTVFYGILNIAKGEIEYINAGHNPPYLLSPSGVTKVGTTHGIALGVIEKTHYTSETFKIRPGEKLFLYTDGITEAFNKEEVAYGAERLENLLLRHLDSPIKKIVSASFEEAGAYVDGAPQSDDITLLTIVYKG
jgi:phosphoserine phosphatase RsbU/P